MAEWNHTPELPIAVSPLWQWPPKPLAALKWYADGWFFLTINMGILTLAAVSYLWLSPTLEQTQTWGLSWVALIFLRNLILISAIAGGLHLWFHKYAMQGQDKKYDPRPFPRKGRMFSFDHQVLDNMFWTLASGVTVWSGFEALFWWLLANGYAPTTTFAATPVWFVAFFFLIPVWESFYFYWIHRLLHTNALYRFHALHHRNTDIGPWSGLSMHPVEHLFYFGTVVIHLVSADPSGASDLSSDVLCDFGGHDAYGLRRAVVSQRQAGASWDVPPPDPSPLFRGELRQSGCAVGQAVRVVSRWHARGQGADA